MATIILKRIPQLARKTDERGSIAFPVEMIPVGEAVIAVETQDLIEIFEKAARKKNLNIKTMTKKEKIELLKSMGYEEYLDILKKEKVFSWL